MFDFTWKKKRLIPSLLRSLHPSQTYVNDAFGTAHRVLASTEGMARYLKPYVAGFLMQKELDYLVGAVSNPKNPFAAIIGGSKICSKTWLPWVFFVMCTGESFQMAKMLLDGKDVAGLHCFK